MSLKVIPLLNHPVQVSQLVQAKFSLCGLFQPLYYLVYNRIIFV